MGYTGFRQLRRKQARSDPFLAVGLEIVGTERKITRIAGEDADRFYATIRHDIRRHFLRMAQAPDFIRAGRQMLPACKAHRRVNGVAEAVRHLHSATVTHLRKV